MRLATRITLSALLFCISVCSFAQDLSTYEKMGTLIPRSPGEVPREATGLAVYRTRGIVFLVANSDGTISGVMVFPPVGKAAVTRDTGKTGDIIPGVGAFGVALGMTKEQVLGSPYLRGQRNSLDDSGDLYYRLDGGRVLSVQFSAGKVSQLDVMRYCRTVDGITEKSTIADVYDLYGGPDQFYDVVMDRGLLRGPIFFFLVSPVLGLCTGFFLRWSRSCMTASTGSLARMAVLGAVALSVTDFVVGVGVTGFMGTGLSQRMLPYATIEAMLTGGCSVLALVLLSRRLSGCLGSLLVLLSMLAIAVVVNAGVEAVDPYRSLAPAWTTLILGKGPFLFWMFVAGRPKQTG